MIASPQATGIGLAALDRTGPDLREHRSGAAIWITTTGWEDAGRAALGLPDPAAVARLLDPAEPQPEASFGRAATRIEPVIGSDHRLHVRRVLHGGWLAPLWRGRIASLARIRRELLVTARLHAAGAPVPEPAFALAERSGPLWRAALCTVHIEGAVDGIRLLRGHGGRLALAAAAAGAAVRDLHDRGLRHADLHVGNLLARECVGGGYEAFVIDLDRARLGAPLGARRRSRELQRLQRSLEKRTSDPRQIDEAIAAFRRGYGAPTKPGAPVSD